MKLSLELLISQFLNENKEDQPSQIGVHAPISIDATKKKISGIRFITQAMSVFSEDVMWVGTTESLLRYPAGTFEKTTLFAAGPESELKQLFQKNSCICIYTHSVETMYLVFDFIMSYFQTLEAWNNQMDLAIAHQEPLQRLLELSEPIIQNPVVAWNGAFCFMAHPSYRVNEIPILQEWIDQGRLPGEAVSQFAQQGYLKRTEEFFTMKQCTSYMLGYPFTLRIFDCGNKQILVLVQYFVYRPSTMAQLELLTLFEEKVAQYTSAVLQSSYKPKTYLYEPFLIDLINGTLSDKDELIDRLKYIHLPFSTRYRLYTIVCDQYAKSVISSLKGVLKSVFQVSRSVEYQQRLYVLNRDESQSEEDQEARMERLGDILSDFSCKCGISSYVENLLDVHMASEQCNAALRIGALIDSSRRTWFFTDIYFYDMMLVYSERMCGNFKSVFLRNLNALIQNDIKSKNDNLKLLRIYLNHDRNITCTAHEMCLHRNSVIYRINRIEQILGLSLDDPKVRFDLNVSLQCLELNGYIAAHGADQADITLL